MCLSVVAKIIQITGDSAVVDLNGVRKEIHLGLLEKELKLDDWVLIHTGFAIAKVDEKKAKEILEAYAEADNLIGLI